MFNGNAFKEYDKLVLSKELRPIDEFFKLQEEEFKVLKIEERIKEELSKINKKYKMYIITSNKEIIIKSYFMNNKIKKTMRHCGLKAAV